MIEPVPLTTEDYQVLMEMSRSDDPETRGRAEKLSKKLTPSEQQAFFEVQAKGNAGAERNRSDNSLLGMPPEFAVASGVPIANAIATKGLSLAGRAAAGGKELVAQAMPTIKFEIIQKALTTVGVPYPVATAVAYGISSRGGSKKSKASSAPDAPEPPAIRPETQDVSAPMSAADLTGAETMARWRAARANPGDLVKPSTLPNQGAVVGQVTPLSGSTATAAAPVAPMPPSVAPAAGPAATATAATVSRTAAALKLTAAETQLLSVLRQKGKTWDEAFEGVLLARKLQASPSFAKLPSDHEMSKAVGTRNSTGRWEE